MNIYDLSEKEAISKFKYSKNFHGMVFNEKASMVKYILSLFLAFLFFGFSLSVSTIFAYIHYKGKIDYSFVKGKLFFENLYLGNIFSEILIKTHIPLIILLLILMIYFFINYIKFRKNNISKFHVNVQRGLINFMIIYYIQALCLSLSIQPQLGIYTTMLYIAILIIICYQFWKGYKEYNITIHFDENYKDENKISNFVNRIVLFLPFLILARQIHLAYANNDFNIKDIEGILGYIALNLCPYLLAIFGKTISKILLEIHTKHYYFNKYPEAFRIQANKSLEEYYGEGRMYKN